MKKKLKNNLSSKSLWKKFLIEGNRLVTLDDKNLLDVLMRYGRIITELIIHRDRKVTSKLKVLYRFIKYLVVLNKRHGSLFVCKYLKASLLSIQRAIAGNKVKTLRELEPDLPLPRLSSSGLPVWIGTRDRRAILSLSLSVVQFYISIYSLHRAISAPVQAKIETITDGFKGNVSFLEQSLGHFVTFGAKSLIRFIPKTKPSNFLETKLLFLQTSSPSQSPWSWYGWGFDAYLIYMHRMRHLFTAWLERTNSCQLAAMLKTVPYRAINQGKTKFPNHRCFTDSGMGFLGRLSFKKEAAGKLRVFAMVDIWTQSIFKPLHDYLFSIIRSIPNDATFDQSAAFERAKEKSRVSGHCFGFDLSAATDRLPVDLQRAILEGLIGRHLSALWHLILIERDYYVPENEFGIPEGPIRYAVGQPMGAYSSWAMLDLCHHAIIQYAWKLIGGSGWCNDYEVLGDDVVIFQPSLAAKYIELMSLYGVELNMSKSVISQGEFPVVEFAKRTSLKKSDVSPISWKMLLNQDHFKGKLSTFLWWKQRIESHFYPAFKVIMKSTRWDKRPISKIANLALVSSLVSQGLIPVVWVLKEMRNSRFSILRKGKSLVINSSLPWFFKIAKLAMEKKEVEVMEPRSTHSYMFEERWYKVSIQHRIEKIIARWMKLSQVPHKDLVLAKVIPQDKYWTNFFKRLDRHLNWTLSKPWLTLIFHQHLKLEDYSLEFLLRLLDEVESAASILNLPLLLKVEKKTQKDTLRVLKLIEKSLKPSVRAAEEAALKSSWTKIRTREEESKEVKIEFI